MNKTRNKVSISEIVSGNKVVVHSDDRPSTEIIITVKEMTYQLYSFQGWYEIIDTDDNHWQFNSGELVEVEA